MMHHLIGHLGSRAALSAAARQLLTGLIILGLGVPFSHGARTLEELRALDQLQVTVDIDTKATLYQRAPFLLVVEVATARWFSRGTRVRDFRIPGAVVRPVSSFADNSSRRINGETWSVQRWRFRVFPRESGLLDIPSLRVFASVNTEAGTVEGELSLSAEPIRIISPPGAENYDDWIATPSLTVEERWDGILERYIPGDAITRTRRFTVEDAPAMMLVGSQLEDVDGLSVYAAPPSVADQSDRGALTGTREETLVVTFEAPGNYRLPGLEVPWFNTRSGEFEVLSLPAIDLEVIAATPAAAANKQQQESTFNGTVLAGTLITLAMVLLLWLGRNTPVVLRAQAAVQTRRAAKQRYRSYLRALHEGDSTRCLQSLYEALANPSTLPPGKNSTSLRAALSTHGSDLPHNEQADNSAASALNTLLEHAYGGGTSLPEQEAAVVLWNAINRPVACPSGTGALRLNPGASA